MTTPISRHEQKLHRQLLAGPDPIFQGLHAGVLLCVSTACTFSCWGHHIGRIMRAHLAGIMTGSLSLSLCNVSSLSSPSCDMCSAVTLQASSPKPTCLVREALPANEGHIRALGMAGGASLLASYTVAKTTHPCTKSTLSRQALRMIGVLPTAALCRPTSCGNLGMHR